FGDGKNAQTTTPSAKHKYKKVGEFPAKLTVSNGDGCTGFNFTGQTASCNGSSLASVTRTVATVKLGKLKRNERKGTATQAVKVPGQGTLTLSGKGVAGLDKSVKHKGTAKLRIKAKGGKKRKLNRAGKLKVKAGVTFEATGSDPNE